MRRAVVVAALGTTQTLAWGSSYYLPAILAGPIAEGLSLLLQRGDVAAYHALERIAPSVILRIVMAR